MKKHKNDIQFMLDTQQIFLTNEITPFDNHLKKLTNGFVVDTNHLEQKPCYKIYNDGGHYVASRKLTAFSKRGKRKLNTDLDDLFDLLYFTGIQNNLTNSQMFNYIKTEFAETFCDYEDITKIDNYINGKIKIKLNNFHKRVKRFKRKANLNRWNYFVSFTYDDKKQTATSFRKRLKKCLSNLHNRRGWKYMGVFELAPDTKRLHFHGLFYIPDGEMVGEIIELSDYSTAQHKMQTIHSNTFFAETFGRNDFAKIQKTEMTINYILKYLQKTGEKIVYSRGIPSEICKELSDTDIATKFEDFVIKYVLFDDVIDWETDIMHFKYYQPNFLT